MNKFWISRLSLYEKSHIHTHKKLEMLIWEFYTLANKGMFNWSPILYIILYYNIRLVINRILKSFYYISLRQQPIQGMINYQRIPPHTVFRDIAYPPYGWIYNILYAITLVTLRFIAISVIYLPFQYTSKSLIISAKTF